jgi:hypothetical protein
MGFYIHDRAESFRFDIAGNLSGNIVRQLERSWCAASSAIGNRPLVISLGNVTGIDASGRELLCKWREAGAQLVTGSPLARTLLGSTMGQRIVCDAGVAKRFGLSACFASALYLIPLLALFFPANVLAVDLEPQTAKAWDMYVDFAQVRMQ